MIDPDLAVSAAGLVLVVIFVALVAWASPRQRSADGPADGDARAGRLVAIYGREYGPAVRNRRRRNVK